MNLLREEDETEVSDALVNSPFSVSLHFFQCYLREFRPSSDAVLHRHEPNRMLMRAENKGFFSFAFDSAHVKYGV